MSRTKDKPSWIDLLVDRLDRAALEVGLDRQRFLVFANIFLPEVFHEILPDQPRSCPPGSADKVEIMRLRVQGGHSLFHPNDSKESFRVAVSGRKGGDSLCVDRKGNAYRAVVNKFKAGFFRTAEEAAAAGQAARAAAQRVIRQAQDAAR